MDYLEKWVGEYVRVDTEPGSTYYGKIVDVSRWNLILEDEVGDVICITNGIYAVTKFAKADRRAVGATAEVSPAAEVAYADWTGINSTNPLVKEAVTA